MTDSLLTTAEVAARLRRSPRFVRDELDRRNLRGSKIGGDWRIKETDLAAYLDAHTNVPVLPMRRRRRA